MIDIELLNNYPKTTIKHNFYDSLIPAIENNIIILNNYDNIELSILISDDKYIKSLNKKYRNIDKATNILSFSNFEPENTETNIYLGDIIISEEKIISEAKEQKKSFNAHLAHMFIHGFLHLLGYDHANKLEATEMENLEIKILNDVNIKNPYYY
ncbi:MAG: rRNA maturation RNase YbeY [Rickettsiales bacterium]